MKFLIALALLVAAGAVQAQQPTWRDYYQASTDTMQASADLELFKSQIQLRKATSELLSVSFDQCQQKVMKSCVQAALAIATLENIDTQWILKHHMHMDELQSDLDNFDHMSRKIQDVIG